MYVTQKPLAQCCALENGADLRVNEGQKIRHYRARSRRRRRKKEEECQIAIFYFARCVRKLALYSDVIYTLTCIRLEICHRKPFKRRWCLKCVIVYIARVIPAFVMYCVNGESRSFLLIESTYSMILLLLSSVDLAR